MCNIRSTMAAVVLLSAGFAAIGSGSALVLRDGSNPTIAPQTVHAHPGAHRTPIYNGFNHQPTQNELGALHRQDVTPDQANKIDQLYDQLLSSSEKILREHPALVH
jgi:hypothetical protein